MPVPRTRDAQSTPKMQPPSSLVGWHHWVWGVHTSQCGRAPPPGLAAPKRGSLEGARPNPMARRALLHHFPERPLQHRQWANPSLLHCAQDTPGAVTAVLTPGPCLCPVSPPPLHLVGPKAPPCSVSAPLMALTPPAHGPMRPVAVPWKCTRAMASVTRARGPWTPPEAWACRRTDSPSNRFFLFASPLHRVFVRVCVVGEVQGGRRGNCQELASL